MQIGVCSVKEGYITGQNYTTLKTFEKQNSGTITIPDIGLDTGETYVAVCFYIGVGTTVSAGDVVEWSNLQVEIGDTATDYESYKESTTHIPNADGTVEDVISVYPTTTLIPNPSGVIVDCEYNKDINKAFAELTQAIISLGGNV